MARRGLPEGVRHDGPVWPGTAKAAERSARRVSSLLSVLPRAPLRRRSAVRAEADDAYFDACWAAGERDGWGCVVGRDQLVPSVACAGRLDPHHVIPVSEWKQGRCDMNNIRTVCRAHHNWIHNIDPIAARAFRLLRHRED